MVGNACYDRSIKVYLFLAETGSGYWSGSLTNPKSSSETCQVYCFWGIFFVEYLGQGMGFSSGINNSRLIFSLNQFFFVTKLLKGGAFKKISFTSIVVARVD